jgi:hypothetical protein
VSGSRARRRPAPCSWRSARRAGCRWSLVPNGSPGFAAIIATATPVAPEQRSPPSRWSTPSAMNTSTRPLISEVQQVLARQPDVVLRHGTAAQVAAVGHRAAGSGGRRRSVRARHDYRCSRCSRCQGARGAQGAMDF